MMVVLSIAGLVIAAFIAMLGIGLRYAGIIPSALPYYGISLAVLAASVALLLWRARL